MFYKNPFGSKCYDHISLKQNYVAGAWSSNTVFSLGRLLLCKAFSQVPVSNQSKQSWLQADGSPQIEEEYSMGESTAEDKRLSSCLKNIRVCVNEESVVNFLLKGWCPKERQQLWDWLSGRVSS